MLPKKNRLPRWQVEELKRKRTPIISGRYFGLLFVPNEQGSRFGVVVSSKISKRAVARNQIRRRVYQAISLLPPRFSGDFLFLAKRSCLNADQTALTAEVKALMEKSRAEKSNS